MAWNRCLFQVYYRIIAVFALAAQSKDQLKTPVCLQNNTDEDVGVPATRTTQPPLTLGGGHSSTLLSRHKSSPICPSSAGATWTADLMNSTTETVAFGLRAGEVTLTDQPELLCIWLHLSHVQWEKALQTSLETPSVSRQCIFKVAVMRLNNRVRPSRRCVCI